MDLETWLHIPHSNENPLHSSLCLEERLTFIHGMAKESVQRCKAPVQHLNFLETCRGLHTQDDRYMVEIGFDGPLSDQVSKKLFEAHSESTCLGLKPELILPKEIKCLT